MKRYILLSLIYGWLALLTGFIQLGHEHERLGPQSAIVTNHFTGEVKRCRVYPSGDMSCHEVDIEPRHWLFALIPFWPGREELDEDHPAEDAARERSFTETALFEDIAFHGIFVLLMLGVTLLVLFTGQERKDGDAAGSGGFDGE